MVTNWFQESRKPLRCPACDYEPLKALPTHSLTHSLIRALCAAQGGERVNATMKRRIGLQSFSGSKFALTDYECKGRRALEQLQYSTCWTLSPVGRAYPPPWKFYHVERQLCRWVLKSVFPLVSPCARVALWSTRAGWISNTAVDRQRLATVLIFMSSCKAVHVEEMIWSYSPHYAYYRLNVASLKFAATFKIFNGISD